MTPDRQERDGELAPLAAALRRAGPPPGFAPGFAARVMRRIAAEAPLESTLVRDFRRYLAPLAVAATIAAAVLNVSVTRDAGISTWERILGWQPAATATVDLYSLYLE